RRATLTPAWTSRSRTRGSREAGPMVATILVRLILESSMPARAPSGKPSASRSDDLDSFVCIRLEMGDVERQDRLDPSLDRARCNHRVVESLASDASVGRLREEPHVATGFQGYDPALPDEADPKHVPGVRGLEPVRRGLAGQHRVGLRQRGASYDQVLTCPEASVDL